MGQCYSVSLAIKVKDEQGAIRALQEKIAKAKEENVNYGIEDYAKEGVGTDTLDDLVRIFLAGWKSNQFEKEVRDDEVVYTNAFDASYGWSRVMEWMFEILTQYIHSGEFWMYPDSGYYVAKYDGTNLTQEWHEHSEYYEEMESEMKALDGIFFDDYTIGCTLDMLPRVEDILKKHDVDYELRDEEDREEWEVEIDIYD